MSVVSISSSDMAARALSSLFCFGVKACRGRFNSTFLDALRIDSPFPPRRLPSRQDANPFLVVIPVKIQFEGVGNQQHVNSIVHSDGLPARLAIHFPVLR